MIRFTHPSGCLKGRRRPLRSDSRVRGARFESYGSFGFIYSLLCDRATILLEDPDEILTRSPKRAPGCCLLRNVSGSAFTSYYLRGCINLKEVANFPAAWSLPCVRFVDVVSPSISLEGFRLFVGNAVAPAMFNDLADSNATLGSYFWLGFITTGLSPDKKRLALLGAQRFRYASPEVMENRY